MDVTACNQMVLDDDWRMSSHANHTIIGKKLTKHYAAQSVKLIFPLDLDAYHIQHPMICRAARDTNVQFLSVQKRMSEGAPETL